jgi:hypothetical protein
MITTPHFITTSRDITSLRDFEDYLVKHNLALATNLEVDAHELHKLATPNWKWPSQGVILGFVVQEITNEFDEKSPIKKKIVPRKGHPPILSKFLSSMCTPFSFVTDNMLPKGQVVFVKYKEIAQVA